MSGNWWQRLRSRARRIWRTEWRIRQHSDGLWYVEFEHVDQGWVYENGGYVNATDAAAAGRKRYEP